MTKLASFSMVPPEPLEAEELAAYRAHLERFPVYRAEDDLFVVFGSAEEQSETVKLYARATTPTFDVESFVQLRPDRILVHPGTEGSGVENLHRFVTWALARAPHRLHRGQTTLTLEEAFPSSS